MTRIKAIGIALAVLLVLVARLAAAEIPLVNHLGFGLAAVYAHAPGQEPWKIAGPLADGETAKIDTSTLQGSRRLIIERAGEKSGEAPALQFFRASYFGDAERMELIQRRFKNGGGEIPTLLTVEDGRKDATIAGLPFDILLSFLESEHGLDAARYAELMTPLAADGWEGYDFAVSSLDISWSLLPPGPVFQDGEEGVRHLAGMTLGAAMPRGALLGFLDEFYNTGVVPTTILMGDGTIYAFGTKEAEAYPGVTLVEGTRDADGETLGGILSERLNGWIDSHGSSAQPGMRLRLESSETWYELKVDFEAEKAELRIGRKDAGDAIATGERRQSLPDRLDFHPAALAGDTEFAGGVALPDGRRWMREILSGRPVVHQARRLAPDEHGHDEKGLNKLILAELPKARDIRIEPFEALAEKTSYPALKATFLTGEGDNARLHVGALIFADQWSFWHVFDTPLEGEAKVQGKELEKLLLTLESMPEGTATPGKYVPVHGADSYRAAQGGLGLMDALIRMELIAEPAGNPWRSDESFAYRYDGTETAEGGLRLLFSFGGDSAEKFTAERHFAVDGRGTVYEMDAVSGPDYVACEETTPNWWGEYRDGGKVLSIGNFRQGPIGYYFIFNFAIDGEPAYEGTAVVSGRRAAFGEVLFRLGKDGDSVEITTNGAKEGDSKADIPQKIAGVYTRR